MSKTLLIFVGLIFIAMLSPVQAMEGSVEVKAGDTQGLIDAINMANQGTGPGLIVLVPGDGGETEFVFDGPAPGFDSALPTITSDVEIQAGGAAGPRITLRAAGNEQGEFRLLRVNGTASEAFLWLDHVNVEGFGAPDADGGAILVEGGGDFSARGTHFRNNFAGRNGGAVAVTDSASADIRGGRFSGNRCANVGGAVSVQGMAFAVIQGMTFEENEAVVYGCDINVNSNVTGNALLVERNVFTSDCDNVLVENPAGIINIRNNTFSHRSAAMDSTGAAIMFGNIINMQNGGSQIRSDDTAPSKPQALCNDFGSGAFQSLGYNISSDSSCALNQPTDLPGVDPQLGSNAEGLPVPGPSSPAIDAGAVEAQLLPNDPLASLPCGYRDISGTARPQDGNGDGVFECDMGAMEVAGSGQIENGHSGAFFNPLRDGEGTYVEILNDTTAIVYTFTYRPDGSGPAWFIGVGEVQDNGIVIDNVLRPVGTSFGNGFDQDDIEFTPNGGMSMVFPDCAATAPGGNVAYSGDAELGYEGLITRAARLSHITGCGAETPHPNAGLSGSWFDPARNGEGIIVEWLPNGNVLVVFFTYDQNDNQMWLIGIGQASGKSVTMDALYPSTFSRWGADYDTADVTISNWGSFTLNWSDCDQLVFDYSSTVGGFDSASRAYSRLSRLSGTQCPDF